MLGNSLLNILINILLLIALGLIIQISEKGLRSDVAYTSLLTLVGLIALTYITPIGLLFSLIIATYLIAKQPYPYKLGSGAFIVAILLTAVINQAVILIKI